MDRYIFNESINDWWTLEIKERACMLQYMVKIQGYMFSLKKSYSIVFKFLGFLSLN